MRRAGCLLLGFLLGLSVQCHPKVIAVNEPINNDFYAYAKLADATFIVAAVNL